MKIGRRSLQILAGLMGLILVSLALVTFWLPGWLVKTQLPKVSTLLGREVSVEKLTLKPWALALEVDGLKIAAQAGNPTQAPLLQIQKISVNASIASLRHLAPVIESVQVNQPVVHIARTGTGQFNFDDIIAQLEKNKRPPSSDAPQQFAVHNIQISSGQIHFDDQPVGKQHRIKDIQLALPFASNFEADIKTHVVPFLSGQLNGKSFATQSQVLPFAKPAQATIDFKLDDMDLVPYLAYVPKSVPLQLKQGRLQAQLQLRFIQANPELKQAAKAELSGQVRASDWALHSQQAELIRWQGLDIKLASLKPFEQKIDLSSISLNGAQLRLERDSKGQLNLLDLNGKNTKQVAPAVVTPSKPSSDKQSAWQLALGQLKIDNSSVHWRDASVKPMADFRLQELALDIRKLQWPTMKPAALQLSTQIASEKNQIANLSINGKVSDQEATLALSLKTLNLAPLAPYTAQQLPLQLSGELGVEGELDWSSGTARSKAFAIKLVHAELSNFKAVPKTHYTSNEAITIGLLTLDDLQLDMQAQQMSLGAIKVQQPALPLHRLANGDWTWQTWLPTSQSSTAKPAATSSTSTPSWRYTIKDFTLQEGALKFQDELDAAKRATLSKNITTRDGRAIDGITRFNLDKISLSVHDFSERKNLNLPVKFSARMLDPLGNRSSKAADGTLSYQGKVALQPFASAGQLHMQSLPINLVQNYLVGDLPVRLRRADLSMKAKLALKLADKGALQLDLAGQSNLAEFQLYPLNPSLDFENQPVLTWRNVDMQGLHVAILANGNTNIDIGKVGVKDAFARLLINKEGKLNLQDVTAAPAASATSAALAAAASASELTTPPTSTVTANPSPSKLRIVVGATQIQNATVDFNDEFIRPNYSAAISNLNGDIGTLRSDKADNAELRLQGRVAGSGDLQISGKLNPLFKPLTLDLEAKVRDLELAQLTPYATKYVGHGIERGKLSVNLNYKVTPDSTLNASNQIILNQLTFGPAVESPSATKLPVLFALDLLKDRNGVIDIDLPVKGSISDPQFSVGGVVFKLVINLIGRAITSPFALLGGLGGSDPQASWIDFEPGRARPAATASVGIEKLAKMMQDKPNFILTLSGEADLQRERAAMAVTRLDQRLFNLQARELGKDPETHLGTVDRSTAASMTAQERERLIKKLYSQTELPNKPRNFIGLASNIPPAQMETLMLAHQKIDEKMAHDLALKRGQILRELLLKSGVPSERIFMADAKLNSTAAQATSKPTTQAKDASEASPWTPRVNLSLSKP
jgi:uncharacterized protein involved in outer membrane biogenesis